MNGCFVITWRPPGGILYFFRGDNRYEIFLPYISANKVSQGWVRKEEYARVFTTFPVFTAKSLAKNFDVTRLKVYPYEKELLPTANQSPATFVNEKPPLLPGRFFV